MKGLRRSRRACPVGGSQSTARTGSAECGESVTATGSDAGSTLEVPPIIVASHYYPDLLVIGLAALRSLRERPAMPIDKLEPEEDVESP